MKTYKTMLSVVLAIMMLVTMIVPAWAASGTNTNDGKITINNAVAGQTYTIYQILKLESYNTETVAYAYKVTDDWKGFVDQKDTDGKDIIKGVYLDIDEQGYVTWVEGADAAAFAKAAEAYAREQVPDYDESGEQKTDDKGNKLTTDRISPVATPVKATTTTVTFSNLNLGYYLVTTTLGTLCSLDTTNKEVTIQEKNGVPTVDKKVQEDSKITETDGVWVETNDADIGQTVNFKTEITMHPGAENYVLHDKMSAGLTYTVGSIKVQVGGKDLTATTDYTVSTNNTDGCTFEITFIKAYLDSIEEKTTVVVTYSATLNENAEIGTSKGNPNETWLKYGDTTNPKETHHDKTITYTWDMDVFKYTMNGEKEKPLQGVEFVLVKKELSGDSLVDKKVAKFTKKTVNGTDEDGKETTKTVYLVKEWVDIPMKDANNKIQWTNEMKLTTDANGKIEVDGLDADIYYLREIEALPGYNVLSGDVEVPITGATKGENDELTYTTQVIEVENNSGTELPSTGGIGTTIFYCAGAILALGAFVLLVTKKRMGRE